MAATLRVAGCAQFRGRCAHGGLAEAGALEEPGVGNLIVARDLSKRLQNFHSSTCSLGPRPLLHHRKEIWFALRTTAATLELGSLLDRERHVMYVAINLR